MDMDVIVLKPLDFLCNTVGSEILANGEVCLNGAIMAFNKCRSVIEPMQFHCLVVCGEDWLGQKMLPCVNPKPHQASMCKALNEKNALIKNQRSLSGLYLMDLCVSAVHF